MKKTILTTIISLQIFILFSQETTKNERIKFKISTIKSFDEDGNLKSIEEFNTNGDLVKVLDKDKIVEKELIYNDKKQISKELRYDSNGIISNTIIFYYNSKEQLIEKKLIDSDGEIDTSWLFEFNENNQLLKETRESLTSGKSITKFKYKNSKLDKTILTNNTIGKESQTSFKYDKKGRLSIKKTRYYYSNTTMTWNYTYNEKGKLISLTDQSSNGVKSTTTYKYNSSDLVIKANWRGSFSNEDYITKYTYE